MSTTTISPSFKDTPTVFWPADVDSQEGYCYGWTKPAICVAGVLEVHSEADANAALSRTKNSNSLQFRALSIACEGEPVLLGTCTFDKSVRKRNGVRAPELKLWPHIKVYITIFYYRHASDTLRFYSLDPIPLDGKRIESTILSPYSELAAHDFTLLKGPARSGGLNEVVLNQFNSAKFLENMGQRATYSKLLPRTASTLLSLGSLASLLWNPVSILCQGVSVLGSVHVTPRLTLKDVSAIAQQIDVRAEQVDFFASEVENIRQRSMSDVPTYAARYTNFFNTVWLILNDLTIGIAFGTFLCENRLFFARMLNRTVEHVLIVWLQWVLGWLDSWPAGLKLNTELSWFYSHTLIDLVNTWGRILQAIMHYMPAIVYGVGIISCWAGATMAISVSMDILALVSTHIYVCYFANRMVYRRMLLTAASLWNLFRGKRYNVLRNRTDSWEYDIDQLLFGTILFTLLAFLFPTVLVYYALFASLRLCTLLLQAGMDSLLAFMNHFPLFALMLRLKDPWRLPGGICIGITQVENKPPIFVVENQPVSLGFIFFQYIQLSSRLARHYNPLRLLYHVLAGEYLTPIPRYSIRYNKMVQTHAHNL